MRAISDGVQITGGSGRAPVPISAVEPLRPSIARLELAECLLARAGAEGASAAADLAEGTALVAECGAGRPVEQGGRNTGSVNTGSVNTSSVNST